jgi:hypothetical protein
MMVEERKIVGNDKERERKSEKREKTKARAAEKKAFVLVMRKDNLLIFPITRMG